MATPSLQSTRCTVEIVTPLGIRLVFDTRQAEQDLVSVQTHNDLAEACGSFQLTFAPTRIQGRTYDQLIPLRSLVTIAMEGVQRQGTETDAIVMVGLTDDHAVAEDFSGAQPRSSVTVSGRSMASVFVDMALRHYPGLEDHIQGTLRVLDAYFNLYIPTDFQTERMDPREALRTVLTYFLGVKSRVPEATRQQQRFVQTQVQAAQAQQPGVPTETLRRQATQQQRQQPKPFGQLSADDVSQIRSLSRVQQLLLAEHMAAWEDGNPGATRADHDAERTRAIARIKAEPEGTPVSPSPPPQTQTRPQGPQQPPGPTGNTLLNLQLPGRALADLLDLNDDTWTMFDDQIEIPIGQNTPYAQTLWHYLHQFIDPVFQEFFTRVEQGVVKVFFRAKPLVETVRLQGTRFLEEEPTCRTFGFTRDAWEAQLLGYQTRRQVTNIYNAFLVLPLGASTMVNDPGNEALLVPVFHADPAHPSYVAKYGLRELRSVSPYMSFKKTGATSPTEDSKGLIVQRSQEWGKKAAAWYGVGSEMYVGIFTVLGDPQWNIGHRLLYADERGEREGYIEGVDHLYNCRTGQYLTHLRVTRLWYLDGLVDAREVVMPESADAS